MKNASKLSSLPPGESAIVTDISCAKAQARLYSLGLIKGTKVTCLHKSPLGDPTAYLIRGAIIALRQEDTAEVQLTIDN